MRLSATAPKKDLASDDNLVPLINIVFLMLIFFMVAGQITASDAVMVQAPESLTAAQGKEHSATVLVAADGSMYLDNAEVSPDRLVEKLGNLLDEAETVDGVSVLVKADAMLPVEVLQEVLQHIKKAGLLKVALLTRQGDAE
ncbi:ExbD/TolR family protein [Marinobacter sp. KMM 10035]|uniref:ExbD/TolR family protein n=1 Tax=Marinobacter sp. KMM 10035 TaxID=3134034 RepID=UPI00397C8FD9